MSYMVGIRLGLLAAIGLDLLLRDELGRCPPSGLQATMPTPRRPALTLDAQPPVGYRLRRGACTKDAPFDSGVVDADG
jgi:hypothetical protein